MDEFQQKAQELSELVNKKLAGEISSLEFMKGSPLYEDYLEWCKEHGEEPSDANADLYIDMTEALAVNSQNYTEE